jgi:amino acid transporter
MAAVERGSYASLFRTPSSTDKKEVLAEDERRLMALGYTQEVNRIFGWFTSFGLAASMISVILGVIPLYSYSLGAGGPATMFWSWIIIGFLTMILVASMGEICSAFPTMGALYYWAFRLGGPTYGPFASWTAGWCNLLGQIAGVASGGYSGAQIISNMIQLQSGYQLSGGILLLVYACVLIFAGIVNTFTEALLTKLCYISVAWHIIGTIIIVIWMLVAAPKLQSADFVFTHFENNTGESSKAYVILIGTLFTASTFTGYDTAAHVAEETTDAHHSTPIGMLLSVINCYVLGIILILGMNFAIQDLTVLINSSTNQQAYTLLWQSTVGNRATMFFLFIVFVAIECSNCANLTSASRMIYAFARDQALPGSSYLYVMDKSCGCPLRAIWLAVIISFLLGVPGLANSSVLSALFSLTATGLYASYMIPILLRVTVARDTFQPAEFNLGAWSIPMGWFSVCWCILMIIILCLPETSPVSISNLNYSPLALGSILIFAWVYWLVSARFWFKGALNTSIVGDNSVVMKNLASSTDCFSETIDSKL